MVLNTTRGVKDTPRGEVEWPDHTLNTSRVVDEDMRYLDESEETEIISVLPAIGWQAVVAQPMEGDGEPSAIALVAWVAEDSGRMYGVAIGEDGRVDLVENDVEKLDGFAGYKQ